MTEPIWLSVARAFVGISEIPGTVSNQVILQWARDLKAPYLNDDVAWCALFICRLCLACGLPLPGSSYDLLRAKSFEFWGIPASRGPGAVLVFHRPGGYHVGLYVGERAEAFYVLGGNQSNAVSYTWIEKARLLACRWPSTVPPPPLPRPVLLTSNGQPVSGNEA